MAKTTPASTNIRDKLKVSRCFGEGKMTLGDDVPRAQRE